MKVDTAISSTPPCLHADITVIYIFT